MAQQMGASANTPISLGVAQRVVLQNPGGSSVQGLARRQKKAGASSAATFSNTTSRAVEAADATSADAAASSTSSDAAQDPAAAATDGAATSSTSTAADGATSSTSSSTNTSPTTAQNAATPPAQQPATAPTQTQAQLPAATQLLLSPTFSPISAQAILDTQNSRIAIPVSQIDGEFIVTMGMMGAGTVQVAPAAAGSAPSGAPQAAAAQPAAGQAPAASGAGAVLARQAAAAAPLGTITMTMAQIEEMAKVQATGGVVPVWSMMSDYVSQSAAQAVQAREEDEYNGPRRFVAVPFKV